jgi:hypothetical protein
MARLLRLVDDSDVEPRKDRASLRYDDRLQPCIAGRL